MGSVGAAVQSGRSIRPDDYGEAIVRERARRMARWAVLTSLLLTALAVAPPASADARGISNGFETAELGAWDRLTGGDGQAGFEIGVGTARSGQGNGYLSATNGWAREGIWASPGQGYRYCTVRFYIKPLTDLPYAVRVWTPQAKQLMNWERQISPNGAYQLVQVDWMAEQDSVNFIEVVFGASGTPRAARLDDLSVVCAN